MAIDFFSLPKQESPLSVVLLKWEQAAFVAWVLLQPTEAGAEKLV